jgi:ribosome-interacting GTPase 1
MATIEEQIESIQREMRKTPYHKGTEGWFGLMRARIAKLKSEIIDKQTKKGGGGGGFGIKKFGDATVVLVGFPSVGKSTLLNKLTNANSPTAEYAFTTVSVIPGMMKYLGAQIQILDVPGLIEGAARGSGRGREVLSVVRGADLLLLIAEVGREEVQFGKIEAELEINGVRLNQSAPNVSVASALRGGIKVNSTVKQDLNQETIIGVAKEFGIINGEITIREKLTVDRLVDAFATSRVYVPAIYVVNKVDKFSSDGTPEVQVGIHFGSGPDTTPREIIGISAENGLGLERLKEKMWEVLEFVRVFLREPGKKYNPEKPLIAKRHATLKDILETLGPDLFARTQAKIWGPGARFPGQVVSLSVSVQDGMEVTFI